MIGCKTVPYAISMNCKLDAIQQFNRNKYSSSSTESRSYMQFKTHCLLSFGDKDTENMWCTGRACVAVLKMCRNNHFEIYHFDTYGRKQNIYPKIETKVVSFIYIIYP